MGTSAITGVNLGSPNFVQSFVDGDLTAGVLTVNHNLNTQYVVVQVYNNSGLFVIPDDIDLVSTSQLTIDLTSFGTLTGTWQAVVVNTGGTFSKSIANDLNISGATTSDRLVYDGTNWVRKPACLFNVYLSANQTGLPVGNTKVAFDTERFDIGGNFNTSTNTFTAPVTGYYQFNASVTFRGVTSTINSIELILTFVGEPNNTIITNPVDFFSTSGDFHMGWGIVVKMDASDTAALHVTTSPTAGILDILSGSNLSTLSGYLIA